MGSRAWRPGIRGQGAGATSAASKLPDHAPCLVVTARATAAHEVLPGLSRRRRGCRRRGAISQVTGQVVPWVDVRPDATSPATSSGSNAPCGMPTTMVIIPSAPGWCSRQMASRQPSCPTSCATVYHATTSSPSRLVSVAWIKMALLCTLVATPVAAAEAPVPLVTDRTTLSSCVAVAAASPPPPPPYQPATTRVT